MMRVLSKIKFILIGFIIFFFILLCGAYMLNINLIPVCTSEGIICPDGTMVGRSGIFCQVPACPPSKAVIPKPSPTINPFQSITPGRGPTLAPSEKNTDCVTGGCSGQLCTERVRGSDNGMASTCEFLPEYACVKYSQCERQADGRCGWTPSEKYKNCLAPYIAHPQ